MNELGSFRRTFRAGIFVLAGMAAVVGCKDEPLELAAFDAAIPPDSPPPERLPEVDAPESDAEPSPGPNCSPPSGADARLALLPVVEGLSEIVFAAPPPGESDRLFLVTRTGTVRVFRPSERALLERPLLDFSGRVQANYAEVGMLGLAFHPDYAKNRFFYLHYIEPAEDGALSGDLIVAEFRTRADDPDLAEAEPTRELLRIPQSTRSHKAGMLAFGTDGMLYVALGNGGEYLTSGDITDLKGKILRLDVAVGSSGYRIPAGQPITPGARPEVWAWGLRNPWRFSFDACTNDLYVADVGGELEEEISLAPGGRGGDNFGYPIREGTGCRDPAAGCDVPGGATEPIASYGHALGCAIIGGYVYRGHDIPSLRGTYLYSDNCSGRFWALDASADRDASADASIVPRELTDEINPDGITDISSFAQDAWGELYVASRRTRTLYRIVAGP